MTIPHNIERSPFRKGEYVGFCNGAQRIRRGGLGWQTYGLASQSGTPIFTSARTLVELGHKLEKLNTSEVWTRSRSYRDNS